MQRPEIRQAIGDAQARRLADGELSALRVLEELRRVAFADVRRLYDEDGRLRPVKEWAEEDAAALAQFEVLTGSGSGGGAKPDRVLKVRMWDKTKALELLAKHFALLVDKTEVNGGITVSWLPAEANAEVVRAQDVKRLLPAKDAV
jgi:phage terminase small subunit